MAANDRPTTKANFSAIDFLSNMIHEGFVGTIPVDLLQRFPGDWFARARIFTYIVVFGSYLFFFITSYIDGLNATFISLDENAGNCHSVGKPLTGTYLASSSGEWEGSAAFQYTEAMYEFTFNDLQVNDEQFADLVSDDFSLNEIAQFTAQNDIATNLLVWMHHRRALSTENGKVQSMQLFARPSGVFRRDNTYAGIYAGPQITGNVSLSCTSQFTTFDTNSAELTFTMPYAGDCVAFATVFQGVVETDGALIRSKVRMNQFSIAASINRQIASVDQLERLYIATTVTVEDQNLNVNAMYDPAFQDSDVFYCVQLSGISTADTLQDICLVDAGGLLLLPILAHADEHCASCSLNASAAAIPCDYIGLLPFYIFLPDLYSDYGAQTAGFIDIFKNTSVTELKIAAARMFLDSDTTYFDQLCPKCAFMWLYMGDDYPSISPYRRVLETGLHCVDSVSSPHFAALAANPPTVLVEKYYVCRATTYANVINAVGLSFGNTSIFAVCFLAFFLPGLYYLTKTVEDHKESMYKKISGRWEVSTDLTVLEAAQDVEMGKLDAGTAVPVSEPAAAPTQQLPLQAWDDAARDLDPGSTVPPAALDRW